MVAAGAVLGALGTGAAWVLMRLIALCLNLFWFGRPGLRLVEPHNSSYAGAWWTALFPVAGGILLGLMIRCGSPTPS